MPRVSARAFAKSVGVSHTAVQKAIRTGRLRKSVGDDGRIDAALAKREWVAGASKPANGGGRPAPAAPAEAAAPPAAPAPAAVAQAHESGTLVAAQVRVAAERASALELANKRKRGELLDAATVQREQFEVARAVRERILNIPDRLGVLEPAVREQLRAELRQALGDLADELERA